MILLAALIPTFVLTPSEEVTNDQILKMGHRAWISRHQPDQYSGAERQFAIALGLKNQEALKTSQNKAEIEQAVSYLATMTKGAARIADYITYRTPNPDNLVFMKANRMCNQLIAGLIANRFEPKEISQSQVWESYRAILKTHQANAKEIEEYAKQGGYKLDQFWIEYNSVGWTVEAMMKWSSQKSPELRRAVFHYCNKIVKTSAGIDPDPYR